MKKQHLLFLLFFLVLNPKTYAQCEGGDCDNGYGSYRSIAENSAYEGYFKNGKKSGIGIYFYGDGGKYLGEFTDDKFHGSGVLFSANGAIYHGSFKNGERTGEAIFENSEGVWAFNWENGQPITEITTHADPDNPSGCKGNCVNGFGRNTTSDSISTLAIFKNNEAVYGSITSKNHNYRGEIQNNSPEGFGVLMAQNTTYLGYFKNGKKEGTGIFTNRYGERIAGEWQEDIFIEEIKTTPFKINFLIELKELLSMPKEKREILPEGILEEQFLNQFQIQQYKSETSDLGETKIHDNFDIDLTSDSKYVVAELYKLLKSCTYLNYSYEDKIYSVFGYNDNGAETSLRLYKNEAETKLTITFY